MPLPKLSSKGGRLLAGHVAQASQSIAETRPVLSPDAGYDCLVVDVVSNVHW